MPRTRLTLALISVLSTAPLAGVALADTGVAPERAGSELPAPARAPGDDGNVAATAQRTAPPPARGVESTTPSTPVPMNLPDEASAEEVKGDYGIGVAGLVIATVLIVALVVGMFLFISRRSWSTSH